MHTITTIVNHFSLVHHPLKEPMEKGGAAHA